MSLLCFGEALIDFLSQGGEPETFYKYPGGAPANVAVAFAKLGGYAEFTGMLGQDMFGDFLLQSLSQYGVGVTGCIQTTQAKTALAFVSLDQYGDRSFSFYRPPAADLLFKAEHFDQNQFKEAQIFHICSNSMTEEPIFNTTITGLELAKNQGCLRSFDINLRLNLWQDSTLIRPRVWQGIANSDVIKMSLEELTFMADSDDPHQHQNVVNQCLKQGAKLVLVTDGGQAIRCISEEINIRVEVPSVEVVDTTAAGDAFIGGLLYALSQRLELKESLSELCLSKTAIKELVRFASRCGAWSVSKKGAFPSLPTLEEVEL